MRESTVEEYLVDRVKQFGGVAEKFVSPQRKNVPDRLVTWFAPSIHFIEVKKPGEKPTDAQLRDHRRRQQRGFVVIVVASKEEVDRYIDKCREHGYTNEA